METDAKVGSRGCIQLVGVKMSFLHLGIPHNNWLSPAYRKYLTCALYSDMRSLRPLWHLRGATLTIPARVPASTKPSGALSPSIIVMDAIHY